MSADRSIIDGIVNKDFNVTLYGQALADKAAAERDAAEQARRDAREKLTGKPWWDMPCKRGECPGGPPSMTGCCNAPHPDAWMDDIA